MNFEYKTVRLKNLVNLTPSHKREGMTETMHVDEQLNEMGGEGWELVDVTTMPSEGSMKVAFFKRPVG